jgi:hypothetical protein
MKSAKEPGFCMSLTNCKVRSEYLASQEVVEILNKISYNLNRACKAMKTEVLTKEFANCVSFLCL